MGTLTYDCPRLDTHCPHKLATSCRLTSTHNCCACADERPHSRTYRVYIDGIGFVQRGTRWQGYCWFCKEFWTNRLTATDPPLEFSQTRIPEIPDQSEFLERWFEFHQGYRMAKMADGTEYRIAVIGEPFREVSPGFLPRTLDQLRTGVENDAQRLENRFRRRRLSSEEERPEEPQQSLDSALDSLLQEATEDETPPVIERAAPRTVEAPSRHHAVPQDIASRGEARLQRARERFARVFGTREDIQQDDYESPLSSMYNRAYDRYRQAEERRAAGTTEPPSFDGLSARERREIEEQLLWGVMRESANHQLEREGDVWSYSPAPTGRTSSQPSTLSPPPLQLNSSHLLHDNISPNIQAPEPETSVGSTYTARSSASRNMSGLARDMISLQSELRRLRAASEALTSARNARRTPEAPMHSLDSQPDRPAPLTDEEMTKTLSCQVCYQQLANIAVLPCGHMVMCQWCADVVIPVKHSHLPVDRSSKCPMCRKIVKQRFTIHM